jgi:hypothetical protein
LRVIGGHFDHQGVDPNETLTRLRLYTVTNVPARFHYMRMDDYLVMYIGSSAEGKEALQK